jgi:hypothetical protein
MKWTRPYLDFRQNDGGLISDALDFFVPSTEDATMTDKEPFDSLTTTAQSVDQITKQTQGAMESYFGWLQTTISALPWSNTNLNRILLSNATQNVTATFASCTNLAKRRIWKR